MRALITGAAPASSGRIWLNGCWPWVTRSPFSTICRLAAWKMSITWWVTPASR